MGSTNEDQGIEAEVCREVARLRGVTDTSFTLPWSHAGRIKGWYCFRNAYGEIEGLTKTFDLPGASPRGTVRDFVLDLGMVRNLARVRLNEQDLGVVWTAPWEVAITAAVRPTGNQLEIEVANLWINRLIGDERFPDEGVQGGRWPEWVVKGTPRPSQRLTFTTHRVYSKDDPLQPSGLIGPVTIWAVW